jgi:hypothetical protein
VLANRLKHVLPHCISNNQSAFVPGRSILDNAMVAIEVLHFMRTKTRGEDRYVALKLDISKAYDRMDWDYLRAVMAKMGFHDRWIHWMGMCVESVDYSVLVNGEQVGLSFRGVVSDKEIPFPRICLLFVQKAYMHSLETRSREANLLARKFVLRNLLFHIFYLLMIVFFFSKQT